MTKGKAMFLLLLFILTGMAIGEIMYRLERRRLRKGSNLSDYGISLKICRPEYYLKGTMILFAVSLFTLFLAYMIHSWNTPL